MIFSIPRYTGTKDFNSPDKKETFSLLPLTPTSLRYGISTGDNKVSTENHIKQTKSQNETEKPVQIENREVEKNSQLVGREKVSASASSALQSHRSALPEPPRKCKDDFDLLSNFIILRSKQVISQSEDGNNVDIQEEGSFIAFL